jgi:serine/threonine protein kinase
MNEMIKRRKKLTEPETAYLMKQLLEAVKYMHDNFVIHRDLKLGNLFLDRNLNIKVGDLGLATRVDSAEEKRKTICGTPNYIAPEVIQGDRATRGHSFEVDIWSMGVILYTSLVGKPPYEAKDVKATYQRILANEYSFPHDAQLSDNAKDLIRNMLQSKPLDRPSLDDIAAHPFLNESPVPFALPSNATHVAPVWKMNDFGELIAVSKSDLEPSSTSSDMKPNIPRSSSQSRRPLSARDVNADRYSDQAKPSNHSKIIQNTYDVPGVVKHVVSSVMGMSGRLTPTSNTPRNGGFEVFDESTALSESRKNAIASSSQKPVQSRQTEDDLVARTAALSLRTQEPSTYSSSTPSPRDPPASSAVNHNMAGENDAILLHQMVDRISTVLDITANRKYSPTQSKSLSLAPFSAGGPTKWVSRYVDYTSKYGLGFLLNDGR